MTLTLYDWLAHRSNEPGWELPHRYGCVLFAPKRCPWSNEWEARWNSLPLHFI